MLFKIVLSCATVLLGLQSTEGILRRRTDPKRVVNDIPTSGDDGGPLFLTPYIREGRLDEGRKMSRVTNVTGVTSYSGYFTVSTKYNSNMFFWFFPAMLHPETAPVLLWLQGGPGASSLFGLFVENGPLRVDANNELHLRNYAWTMTHSVIYVDNPVGTGFSFTESDAGYARSEDDVARDLYSALTQFFTLFPEFASRDFYVSGESYAGHYVPAIAHKIHMENRKSPKVKINLKGVAIGDGIIDPISTLNYGTYLRYIGLIDATQEAHFHAQEEAAREAIKKQKWLEAFEIVDALMFGYFGQIPYFKNATGFSFHYNFLQSEEPADQAYFSNFVQLAHVRRGIHVGSQPFSPENGTKVAWFLRKDMYQSTLPWLLDLLDATEGYRVLIYSGQLDVIVAHTLTEAMLDTMEWSGAREYANADKVLWTVGDDLAGYVKNAGNLTYVLVRNAGHILPYDQPKWSFDMINRFTRGQPFA